jgi:MoaA/NifB/PqqE/SkfB family radical SAM enzyme
MSRLRSRRSRARSPSRLWAPSPARPARRQDLLGRRHESFAWNRLRWRLGRREQRAFTEPPAGPVGAKLELTYSCNLRCGFCYTDSPRRTLQRSTDLGDDDWRRIVEEAIAAGIVEAVVTGGEPLLRRDLTLEVVEALTGADIGVTLNTNGWFVDGEVAGRLGALGGVTAHVSLDGARPGLHDASRGVPGSWRRAVRAVDHLLSAGVGVCVVHVVTPANEAEVPEMLEQMWLLGIPWMRVTSVVETGAAARGGSWRIDRGGTDRAIQEFRARRGEAMRIDFVGTAAGIGLQGKAAPGSLLVRPNGDVRIDSLRPFTFGNAVSDGIEECWRRIRAGWRDEQIETWAESMGSARDLARTDVVPYLDDEVPVGKATQPPPRGDDPRVAPVPAPARLEEKDPELDHREAREMISRLATARRYRLAHVRVSGGAGARIVRRSGDGRYVRLNPSGGAVLDALAGGSQEDAAGALAERFGVDSARARSDAAQATRELLRLGVIAPAGASHDTPAQEPGTSDVPGEEPDGARAVAL